MLAERVLCKGGLSAPLETLVSRARGVLVQRRGDSRRGLVAMLQAQGLEANRLWQKERSSELGEFSRSFSCFFLSTHCLAPGWLKQSRFS